MKYFNFFLFLCCLLLISSCREGIVEYDPGIKTGDLYINSNPNGAEILFNFTKTGKTTPDSLIHLQPGNYTVTVRLLGYGEETINVSVVAGEKKYVDMEIN